MSRQAKADKDMNEKALELLVIGTERVPGAIRGVGWLCYHTLRSKGSVAGYPDWSCFRERHVYIELKSETNSTSDAQKKWLRAIIKAGVECYVVRPRNITDITVVMASRRRSNAARLTEGWTPEQVLARTRLVDELSAELTLDDELAERLYGE